MRKIVFAMVFVCPVTFAAVDLHAASYSQTGTSIHTIGPGPVTGFQQRSASDTGTSADDLAVASLAMDDYQAAGWTASNAGRAGPGAFGAYSQISITNGSGFVSSAGSFFESDDLIFDGTGATGNTSLNLVLGGSLTRSDPLLPYGGVVRLGVSVRNLSGTQTYLDEEGELELFPSDPTAQGTGLLAAYSGSGSSFPITTSSFPIPINEPLYLAISLDVNTGVSPFTGINVGTPATTTADFLHTLTLPETGAAFNNVDNDPLFNADSPGFSLANNSFTPVPEPATLAALPLLAGALIPPITVAAVKQRGLYFLPRFPYDVRSNEGGKSLRAKRGRA